MNRAQRMAALSVASKRMSWEWTKARISDDEAAAFPVTRGLMCAWFNDLYSVQRYDNSTEIGTVVQFSIRSQHGRVIPWDDLQRIKNELAGKGAVAVEVFPADGDVIDQAPIRHLWVLPEGYALPFGLHRSECWGGGQ